MENEAPYIRRERQVTDGFGPIPMNYGASDERDPWINRSMGMRCHTCVFFVEKKTAGLRDRPTQGALGRCRRHAPTMSGYPAVYESDWCGDHKLDENKA